jgi:hypothetical protein
VSSYSQATNGSVILSGGTILTYTYNSQVNNEKDISDSFTYTVSDGHGHTATATVAVSITVYTHN